VSEGSVRRGEVQLRNVSREFIRFGGRVAGDSPAGNRARQAVVIGDRVVIGGQSHRDGGSPLIEQSQGPAAEAENSGHNFANFQLLYPGPCFKLAARTALSLVRVAAGPRLENMFDPGEFARHW